MHKLKYFFQFIIISFLFLIFRILGLKLSKIFSVHIMKIFGPFFRSNKILRNNLLKAFPSLKDKEIKKIIKSTWENYGKIFSEYVFLKEFRNNSKFNKKVKIINKEVLDHIKLKNKPVIFISGHFNNFELMAMNIEKSGIDLAAIYRPLNNFYLNPIMENIRKKYICRNQIKKGQSGTRQLLKYFKKNISVALMIDQRVSEGIKCELFNSQALTTTLPAQFVKKFNSEIVPVYIERTTNENFNIIFYQPLKFQDTDNVYSITKKLNYILEKMILRNPSQWIWTHNRWK